MLLPGCPGGSRGSRRGPRPLNLLLVTVDQFRGDCLSAVGHPIVRTPNLDLLARSGTLLRRHYAQSAPCGPGRASLYTGMYQMNHRVVGNGTPLDHRFDNLARAARPAGYKPALFGYTDQGIDPKMADGPTTRGSPPTRASCLASWPSSSWSQSRSPGCGGSRPRIRQELPTATRHWPTEPLRPAELGISAFLTDRLLEWLRSREGPWFAHASYFRPHPPYAAAGHWSEAYDPDDVADPIAAPDRAMPPADLADLRAPTDQAMRSGGCAPSTTG